MEAVMYGGGKIGRGFITQLFNLSGYHTTFVDVMDKTVSELNTNHCYNLYITDGDDYKKTVIDNVSAVDGKNPEAVAQAIANADIMATAVGVNILPKVASPIALGVKLRMKLNKGPLNIIVCENKIDANVYLQGMVASYLNDEEKNYFENNFGFVEASIGRMVPVTPKEISDKEPLAVCVEPFNQLPVDKNAFKGTIPHLVNLVPYSPFELFIERKLYMHNMSHAVCAYLGNLMGYEYIWQAIADKRIRYITIFALIQSAQALALYHNADLKELIDFSFDLISRYDNKLLKDTVARVGNDTQRKLSSLDRIPGAIKRARQYGLSYNFICCGLAAGLLFAPRGDESSIELAEFTAQNGVKAALWKYSDITDEEIISQTEKIYNLLKNDPDKTLDDIVCTKL